MTYQPSAFDTRVDEGVLSNIGNHEVQVVMEAGDLFVEELHKKFRLHLGYRTISDQIIDSDKTPQNTNISCKVVNVTDISRDVCTSWATRL